MCSAASRLFLPPHDIAQGGFVDALASSLGTGNTVNSFPPSSAGFPYGILDCIWPKPQSATPAFPLVEAMLAGSRGRGDLIAWMLLRRSIHIGVDQSFNRNWSLDDCSAIEEMMELTRQPPQFRRMAALRRQDQRARRLNRSPGS
jgi:hypothetical protein